MYKAMRKIYLSIISIFVMTTISSCMTTSGFLTQSKLNESNRRFQQEQLNRAEEAKRERFRITANQSLGDVVYALAQELFQKLGKGTDLTNNFQAKNIKYNYINDTAECPIGYSWVRRNKIIFVGGTLIFYSQRNYVKFICTDAENTRLGDNRYIKELSEGIIFNLNR